MRWRIAILCLALGACAESGSAPDDAGADVGPADVGGDGGVLPADAGFEEPDAGMTDSGAADTGVTDAGASPGFVAYAGGTYAQSFDGLPVNHDSDGDLIEVLGGRGPFGFDQLRFLPASGLEGWYFANHGGSGEDTEVRSHDGRRSGSFGRGVVAFGSDGAEDRALGALPTGNQIARFGVVLRNDSAVTYRQLTVAFAGEQWRRGNTARPNTLGFEYGLGEHLDAEGLTADPELSFRSVNTSSTATEIALDGNASEHRVHLEKTLHGILWRPGESLVLRFTIDELSGQDDGLAIDDFTFSASPVQAEPDAGTDAGVAPDGGDDAGVPADAGEADGGGAPDSGETPDSGVGAVELLGDGSFEGLVGTYAQGASLGQWRVVTAVGGARVLEQGVTAHHGQAVFAFDSYTTGSAPSGFGDNRIDTCVPFDPTRALHMSFAFFLDAAAMSNDVRVRLNPNFYASVADCEADVALGVTTGRLAGNWANADWDVRGAAAGAQAESWFVATSATHTGGGPAAGPMVYTPADYPPGAEAVRMSVRIRDDAFVSDPTRRVYLDAVSLSQPE